MILLEQSFHVETSNKGSGTSGNKPKFDYIDSYAKDCIVVQCLPYKKNKDRPLIVKFVQT